MKKFSLVLVLAMLMSVMTFTASAATEESAVWNIQEGWNGMFIATAEDAVAYEARIVNKTHNLYNSEGSLGSAVTEGDTSLFMKYGMGEAGQFGKYGHLYAYSAPLALEDGKTYTVSGIHFGADTGSWATALGIGSFNETDKTAVKPIIHWINDTTMTQTEYTGYWKNFSFDFTYNKEEMGENLSFYAYIRACGYNYASEFAIDNIAVCEKGTTDYALKEGFGLDAFGLTDTNMMIDGDTVYITSVDDFRGDVILASYTADGTLVDAKVFEDTFLYDNKVNEFSIADMDVTGASAIKMFLWDSMRPATLFDDVNGDYNTISVDGSSVTAKIKIEDDIADGIVAYTASQYGNDDTQATVTEENGYYIIEGTFSNYKQPVWGTWRGINIYSGGGLKRRYSCDFENAPTNAYTAELIENMKHETEMLEVLMAECASKGLSTDYEELYANVIKYYTSCVEGDLSRGDFRYIWYSYDRCMSLYDEAKENLMAYLNGEKTPLDVPKYVTSDIAVDGITFMADTEYKGEIVNRPVHLVGYNYFGDKSEIDDIAAAGGNHIQKEMGPDSVIVDGKIWTTTIDGDAVSAELSTTRKNSGTQSLHITNTAATGSLVLEQTVKLKANTTYYFGVSAYGSGVTSAKLSFSGTTVSIPTSTAFRWKSFGSSITTVSAGTQTIKLEVTGSATNLFIDDVYVCEGSTDGTNSVANPGFEDAELESDKEWRVDYTAIDVYCDFLKTAEENNVTVDFLISTHYVPAFLKEKYPDTFANASQYMSELYRAVVKDYLDAVIPAVSQYKSLKTICLMNEPSFAAANYGDEYTTKYREYLKTKYSDSIDALNNAWSTSYASFDSISMPAHSSGNQSVEYHDYFLFNNTFMTDYHQFLADTIRAHTDIPLHSKPMWVMGSHDSPDDRGRWNVGIDWEGLADVTDYNGNDNIYYLQNLRMDWYRDEMSKSITYDYQLGVKYAPVVNSEDHIIPDYDLEMSDEQKKVNTADVWQNAFHGRAQSALWAWSRPTNAGSILFGGLGARPDVVAEIGKATYDLNRLSWEIKAVNDQKAEIGVLYSDYTRRYNSNHLGKLYDAYEKLYFSGYKAAIVPESKVASLDENIKILVIPNVTNVTEATINAIYDLANSGVKIVMYENGLSNNEFNKTHTSSKVSAIKDNATMLTYGDGNYHWTGKANGTLLQDDLDAIADEICDNKLRLIDTATGKPVENTEYILGYYNGKAIISVCNYDWRFETNPTVEVYLNDVKLTNMTELRSNELVGDSVSIMPFEPILLQAEIN